MARAYNVSDGDIPGTQQDACAADTRSFVRATCGEVLYLGRTVPMWNPATVGAAARHAEETCQEETCSLS
jgi:hypothetical protein